MMSIQVESTTSLVTQSARRVMIVDDSLTVRKVIVKTLTSDRFQIRECASGKEALEELQKSYYDLIFLDYILPDTKAASFLQELLKNTHYSNVPVVLMSSKGAEIERLSEFNDNVIDTLTKPFTTEAVLGAAEQAFGEAASPKHLGASSTTRSSTNTKKRSSPSQARVLLEKGLTRVASHIPALEQKRGGKNPKSFYLRYLLHPELVNSIEQLQQQTEDENSAHKSLLRSGPLDCSGNFELLQELSLEQRTGRLDLIHGACIAEIHLHKGIVVGVGTKDSDAYASALAKAGLNWDEATFANDKNVQDANGKPFILDSTSTSGSSEAPPALLFKTSEILISSLLANDCSYRYWDQQLAPEWAINNSLNIDIAEFFLRSLRQIHGWETISREIGDLTTRFTHRFQVQIPWYLAYLTSFETVVLDFLKYKYSVTELASTLGEIPSRVAETIHTLHQFGILTKSELPDPNLIHQELYEHTKILLLSSKKDLLEAVNQYAKSRELEVHHCSNTKEALYVAQTQDFNIIIDDGSSTDGHLFEASKKLKAEKPERIFIVVENEEKALSPQTLIRLHAQEFISRPLQKSSLKQILNAAVEDATTYRTNLIEDSDELKSINSRLTARQQKLNEIERTLQKREHELLHNEEVFFEKCNRFEEERTRLDILQDEHANY